MKKFSKILAVIMAAIICISFASCSKRDIPEYDNPEDNPNAVRTGLSVISEVRTDEVETDSVTKRMFISTAAAVLVDEDGKVIDVKVDIMEINSDLEDNGGVVTELKSAKELGNAYKPDIESETGKSKTEQIVALEEFCKGKTADEINESFDYFSGITKDESLLKDCDINVKTEVKAITQAMAGAKALDAQSNDTLKLSISAQNVENTDEEKDILSYRMQYAAVTVDKKGVITSCLLDESEGNVTILDGEFKEFPGVYSTKKQLGIQYGLKAASSINSEWFEQIKGLENFAKGKTASELTGVVGDDNFPTDSDLLSVCTIEVNELVANLVKAVNS